MTDLPEFTVADLEAAPRFDVAAFTRDDAISLGIIAVEAIREQGASLAVRIALGGQEVFTARLGTTDSGADRWLTGKAAVAEQFGEPSLLVRRRHQDAGTAFEDLPDVDHTVLQAYGGAIPLFVDGSVVGTITTSGEPDVVDHAVAAEALRRYLAR